MKLKSLTIEGFKSFADKTTLQFNKKITGIVGPNGCGKSNIVDAIRWVMGEQSAKHLRGRGMEDVIFSGTEDRPPASCARVELVFSTQGWQTPPQFAQCEEISIGRTLFRSGESEYTINRQPVRLKDVTDFFLGTGVGTKAYSITEQGRIEQIILAKPEDRRSIIEEAAGISKYKSRKEAALRRMETTRLNLSRLGDIIHEVERQKNTLEKQAKRARHYKEAFDELKELELKLAAQQYQRLKTEENNLLKQLKQLGQSEQDARQNLSGQETQIETQKLRLAELESSLQDVQQHLFDKDNQLKLCESQRQNKMEFVQRLQADVVRLDHVLSELHQNHDGMLAGLAQVNEKLFAAELECARLEDQVQCDEGGVSCLQEKNRDMMQTLEAATERKLAARQKISEIIARHESLREKISDLERMKQHNRDGHAILSNQTQNLKKLSGEFEQDFKKLEQLKSSLQDKTALIKNELENAERDVAGHRGELSALKEELLQKKSRLASLEKMRRDFEGYQEGAKHILQKQHDALFAGVMGSIADIVESPPEYETAVSAVLAERVHTVLVKDEGLGIRCLEYLKETKTGRGSFMPLQSEAEGGLSLQNELEVEDFDHSGSHWAGVDFSDGNGVLGLIRKHVKLKAGYDRLANILFGDVLVSDGLKNAVFAWQKYKKPVVTLEGEYISCEGVFSGGSGDTQAKAFLETRRETTDLSSAVQPLLHEIKSKEEICLDQEHRIRTLQQQLEEVRSSSHEEELKLVSRQKDMLHLQDELKHLEEREQELNCQMAQTENDIVVLQRNLKGLEQEKAGQEKSLNEAEKTLLDHQAKADSLKYELAQLQEKLTQNRIQLARACEQKVFLQKEVERFIGEHIRLRCDLSKTAAHRAWAVMRIIFLEDRAAFLERNAIRLVERKEGFQEQCRKLKSEFEQLVSAVREAEHNIKQLRHAHEGAKDQIGQVTVALAEVRGGLSRLGEQCLERYHTVLSDSFPESLPGPDFDAAWAEERVRDLRLRVSDMGSVNIAAIEELDETSQRHEFLMQQRADLEQSLAALDRAIQKINKTSKKRFQETFDLINEKFTHLFPRLFQGGHAELRMTDPENILETGVEIVAQPPGKKLQSVSLLSGGEKALTAISLLFAIFLVKPSPFCLLDEVDAPLDDVNVERYNSIVREMAENTQFIVITHNKRSMYQTECLFGVTMQQKGVSQIVSVQIG